MSIDNIERDTIELNEFETIYDKNVFYFNQEQKILFTKIESIFHHKDTTLSMQKAQTRDFDLER